MKLSGDYYGPFRGYLRHIEAYLGVMGLEGPPLETTPIYPVTMGPRHFPEGLPKVGLPWTAMLAVVVVNPSK